ncbi:SpaA isopeptide-forming pilin-related protein [Vagococcus bubulae]|uniref:SpaA isopeptide-forming pilin-related protein n=1 Tax=Vagococcus bubulae TaxID=1977868 RepID=UPI0022E741A5|nr:SpaA isopeptide-forming pilin-related protein [Vagococcus bubulae]
MKLLKEKQFGFWLSLILIIPYFLQPVVAVAEGLSESINETEISLKDFKFDTSDKSTVSKLSFNVNKESETKEEFLIKSSEPLKQVTTVNSDESMSTEVVKEGFKLTLSSKNKSLLDFQLETVNENVDTWNVTLPNGETKEIHKEKTEALPQIEEGSKEDKPSENDLGKTINPEIKTPEERQSGDVKPLLDELNEGKSLIESLSVTLDGKQPLPPEGIKVDQPLRLAIKWAIPEKIAQEMLPGDFYEFKLPEQVQVTPRTGNLSGQDGVVFGTYKLTSDGTVRFEFNEEISKHGFIEGEFIHNQQLKNITKPGKVEIRLPQEQGVPPVEVLVKSNTDSVIEKSGQVDKQWGANNIDWTIDINKSLSELKNVKVEDILPVGLSKESISVVPIDVTLDGEVSGESGPTLVENVDYEVKQNTVIFLKDVTQAYRIKLKSKIGVEAKTPKENEDSVYFTNKAILHIGDKQKETSATVEAHYYKNLTKSGPYRQDKGGQIYEWEVKANYLENEMKTGTKIQDRYKLPKDATYTMGLVPNSVKVQIVTFDESGNEQYEEKELPSDSYKIVDKKEDGFDIELIKDIKSAIKITYLTKVNGYVSGYEKLGNDVAIDGEYTNGSAGYTENQNLVKWYDKVNYEDKTIGWILDVNRAQYNMIDWVLTDKMSPGQTLIEDSLIVQSIGEKELVVNKDYKVEVDGQQFKVIFLGDLAKGTDKAYRITYKTSFDIEKIDQGHGKEDENNFWNESSHDWTDKSGKKQHADTGKIEADLENHFKYNGSKHVSYKMKDKAYDWVVDVNVNRHKLVDAVVEDVIKGQHELIEDSIKIYELTVYSNSVTDKETDVTSSVIHKVMQDGENKKIRIELPKDSTKAYRIEYRTSHEGKLVKKETVSNKAVFENNHVKHELSAETQPFFAGETIQKTGKVNPENGNEILWDALINPSQSHLENVVITDKPSSNQVLDKQAIKLYSTVVGNDENDDSITQDKELTAGKDFEVDITSNDLTGEQVLTVKLIGDLAKIDTSYMLRYVTTLNNTTDKSNVEVFNSIKLNADHVESMNTETSSTFMVVDNEATATGKAGKIRISKYSSFDNKPLEGAHFEIWKTNRNKEKKQLLRSGVTNKEGQWDFGNIRPGSYLLVETKAPDNFLISPELKNGRLIEVKAQENITDIQEFKATNDPNEIIVTKQSADGQKLSGATFNLLDESKQLVLNDTPLVSNEEGVIRLSQLKEGTYYLKEISAPNGYIRNDELLPIHVTKEKSTPLTFTNYQGSVSFDKIDGQTNQALSGATFDILSLDKPELSIKGITGDDKGHFTVSHLAPGNYKLVETKAPNGYVLNTEGVTFSIPEHAINEPAALELGQIKNVQGTAKFNKVSEEGKGLSGAVFKLTDKATQTVIKEELQGNEKGEFEIKGLAPGEYLLEEIMAPTGYIRNTEIKTFSIDNKGNGEVETVDIGSIVNYKGKINFDKVKEDGNSLLGAKFQIINQETKEVVVKEIQSDDKGHYMVDGLAPGNYELEETHAPVGYIRNKDNVAFTIPTEVSGKPEETQLSNVVNYQGDVHFKKVDETNQLLNHAEFKLSDKQSGKVIKKDVTEVSPGEFAISGLAPGEYVLEETNAPEGYILNTEVSEFTIQKDESGKPTRIELKDFVNYQGSVSFKKTTETGELLSGAIFSLRDAKTKHIIQENIKETTTGEFVISHLAPNDYELVETNAPEGYILNTKPISFSIKEKQQGKPSTLVLDDVVNYQGSVSFNKVDDKGNSLSGAEFKIVNKDSGQVIQESLKEVSPGEFKLDHLAPGTYSLEEVVAPTGYIKNTQVIEFTIDKEQEGTPQTIKLDSFTNYQGSLLIKKMNEDGRLLSDAVFELSRVVDGNNQVVATDLTTNLLGEVAVNHLIPGEYVVREIKAPLGYKINTQEFTFKIEENYLGQPEQSVISVTDYQGSIQITKTNKENQSLADATFAIRDAVSHKVVKDHLTTDSTGKVIVGELIPGTYELVETNAPTGYVRNEQAMPFDVSFEDKGQPKRLELSMINYQGSVLLQKVDESNQPLTGAVFNLIDQATKDVIKENLEVDSQGSLMIDSLAPGTYELQETKSPTGYIINTENTVFTISESSLGEPESVKAVVVNYKAKAEFKKTDKNGQVLENAVFELYDKTSDTKVKEHLVTDKSGKVVLDNLSPGDYELVETQAPTGYILNTEKVSFKVEDSQKGEPQIINVKDIVNYQGTVEFTKVDETGRGLEGAIFEVLDKDGKAIQENITGDKNGKFVVENLSPGEYELVETQAPTGYILNTEKVSFKVEESQKGQPEVMTLKDVVNYQGTVEFTKVDETGRGLEGAIFEVLDKDGKTVQESITGDKDGKFVIENLSPGDYELVETQAPTGYILNTEKVSFKVEESQKGQPEVLTLKDVVNYQGTVEFTKVDETGKGLEGAIFEVLDKDGKTVQENITGDKDGKFVIENLSPGEYELVETQAPTGYILNTEKVSFKVEDSQKGHPQIMTLKDVVNYQGTVEFAKVDETGKGLEGAIFEVVDKDGKAIQENITGDKDGKFVVENLSPGDYELVETQAPTGYILNTEKVSFKVEESQKGQPEVMTLKDVVNYQGTVEFTKVDETGKGLEGAIFKVVTKDGKAIQENITGDKDGKFVIENLSPGEYELVETKAPVGYERLTTVIKFTVNSKEAGKVKSVQLENIVNKKIVPKPDTSESSTSESSTGESSTGESSTSESSTTKPSTSETNRPNSSDSTKKSDATHLPKTGEDMVKHWILTIIGLVLIASMVVIYKKRQK